MTATVSDLPSATVRVKKGRAKPLWLGHPWLFSQAIERMDGTPASGDLVRVVDHEGRFIGLGLHHATSSIAVRVLSRLEEPIDAAFFHRRVRAAWDLRQRLGLPSDETSAFRLINAEGDELPGVNVDVYADVVTFQLTALGLERRAPWLVEALHAVTGARAIVRVVGGAGAEREGLSGESGVVFGEPPGEVEFLENGLRFALDPLAGQKTGAFLDQRENRRRLQRLSRGATVLDLYTYQGGFALNALRGGADRAVAVDISARAVERTRRHGAWAGFADRLEVVEQDCFRFLETTAPRSFDLVICDPPKFAPTRGALEAALKGYRRLNASALRACRPGALFVTASCSGLVDLAEFERVIATASQDVGRRLAVLETWFQGADHPVPPGFAEGRYLKVLLCRVD